MTPPAMTDQKIRVLVVGAGNMGRSHALAYASIPEFEIAAVCTRRKESRASLMNDLPAGTPEVDDYEKALLEVKPDAVCISTYPDTHYPYAKMALDAGCHVFTENHWLKTPSNAGNLSTWPGKKRKPWWWGISFVSTPAGSNLWRWPGPWANHWLCA